jgi:hypothetical protein
MSKDQGINSIDLRESTIEGPDIDIIAGKLENTNNVPPRITLVAQNSVRHQVIKKLSSPSARVNASGLPSPKQNISIEKKLKKVEIFET